MNERIRELAKQAYEKTQDEFQEDWDGTPRQVWDSKFQEKFAELIVQDMHRNVIASILITDVVMEEKGLTPTSEDYIRAIHKDFGVEE